jgi:hypothetical protein
MGTAASNCRSCCSCFSKKEDKNGRFSTIPVTRRYVQKQRLYLFLHLLNNVMLPYWTCVVPLFVLAGSSFGSLEQYFVLILYILTEVFWSFLCMTPTRYPQEAVSGHTMRERDVLGKELKPESLLALERAGRRKSTPSLLRVLCLSESWKELFLGKLITCIILFVYAMVILAAYIMNTSVDGGKSISSSVNVSTAATMYVTFFVSLYYVFTYNGPFYRDLVTREKGLSDWRIFIKIFTTRFPDDVFPCELTFWDCFRPSADILVELRTLSAIAAFYRVDGDPYDLEARLTASEALEEEAKTINEARMNDDDNDNDALHKKERLFSTMSVSTTSTISQFPFANDRDRQNSVDILSDDDRFTDNSWELISRSPMTPSAQLGFLYMMHAYITEGMSKQVGVFLEKKRLQGERLAQMLAIVDEHRSCYDLCSFCQVILWYRVCCCWCQCCCNQVATSWKEVESSELTNVQSPMDR